jgi:excisionase family DNA binding protein
MTILDERLGGVTAMNKCLLRVDEAAMQLSVSRWTIYRWVQEGRLEATKVGKGSLRIFQGSVTTLIERNRTFSDEPVHCHDGRPTGMAPGA